MDEAKTPDEKRHALRRELRREAETGEISLELFDHAVVLFLTHYIQQHPHDNSAKATRSVYADIHEVQALNTDKEANAVIQKLVTDLLDLGDTSTLMLSRLRDTVQLSNQVRHLNKNGGYYR